MASGKFGGAYGSHLTMSVYWGTVSKSIENNTSRVRVWATLSTSDYGSVYGVTAPLTININGGGAIEQVAVNIGAGSTATIWQKEYTINHNADGTKSFNISLTLALNVDGYSSCTVSQTATLGTIPRASDVTVNSVTIGSALNIKINRVSDNFKHTVRYGWYNKTGVIASNIDTSTSWTVPMDFCNDMPNSASSWGTIYVDTYSGGTLIGTKSATFTATVPASVKPTFTGFRLSDTNAAAQKLIPNDTHYIQVISNIQVDFDGGKGVYGSSIAGYKAEIVGKNQSTTVNGGTLGLMPYSGEVTVRASVFDSRGRQSDVKETKVTVLEYFAPTLSFDVQRSGSTSSTFTVNRNARIAALSVDGEQKNVMTLSFKVAQRGSTSYTTDSSPASGSWLSLSSLTNSQANLSGTYAANKAWTVIGTLEDRFTKTEFMASVATESVVMSYDTSGVGINKIRERGALDVRGDIYANDSPIQQHELTRKDGRSPYNAANTLDLNTCTINKFFSVNVPINGPSVSGPNEFYVAVYSESDNYLSQMLIQKGTGNIYTRTRHGGNWTNWLSFASASHNNLVNSGWQTAGMSVSWAKYKKVGDVVYIDIQVPANTSNRTFGYLPAGYRPSHGLMLPAQRWRLDGLSANVQIEANGEIIILNASSDTVKAQVSFCV
ncbi:DUF859 family phage minor structural protein [Streptococcus chenjunshii]|nr:DUF859 family phage minor structural protein [Streptococcus chenjunshii]